MKTKIFGIIQIAFLCVSPIYGKENLETINFSGTTVSLKGSHWRYYRSQRLLRGVGVLEHSKIDDLVSLHFQDVKLKSPKSSGIDDDFSSYCQGDEIKKIFSKGTFSLLEINGKKICKVLIPENTESKKLLIMLPVQLNPQMFHAYQVDTLSFSLPNKTYAQTSRVVQSLLTRVIK